MQHGLSPGKSTVINVIDMIVHGAAIADAVAAGCAYFVISFGFKRLLIRHHINFFLRHSLIYGNVRHAIVLVF